MSAPFDGNRRLVILQGLHADADYMLSCEMVQRLLAEYGHRIALQAVREDISWLDRAGLVTVTDGAQGMTLATLTRRGVDVALGYLRVAGVDRPLPT